MGAYVDQLVAAGYGGYRGWNDREAEADFRATGGKGKWDPPVSESSMTTSAVGGGARIDFSAYLPTAKQYVDPYYSQLLVDAQGDWDRVKKYLADDFTYYLGQGNTQMASFIKQVANETEKRQGILAYDYEQAKKRIEEDYQTQTQRLTGEEKAYKEEEALISERAKRERMGGYLERLGGAGTMIQPTTAKTEAEEEKLRQMRMAQYLADVKQRREDLLKQRERGLEDITTTARRGIISRVGATPSEGYYTLEKAPTYLESLKEYEKKKKDIEQERTTKRLEYVDWLAQRNIKDLSSYLG